MAKGSKDQTISSVSDIVGFLLEESRKPPDKRRPVKTQYGDIQSDSEYVSALVDALALPGTLIGDKYLDTIQGMVDPAVKVGTYKDRIGQVKIKLSDLPDFYDNPDEFIDKLFEKNKAISNKMQQLQWAGEQMRMLHGSAYARREKLFDSYSPEMRDVLIRAMGQTAGRSSQAYDQIWVREAFKKVKDDRSVKLQNMLNSESDPERIRQISNELSSIQNSSVGGKGDDPINNFSDLLRKEFDLKGKDILRGRKLEDLSLKEFEEYNKTIQARNLLGFWGGYESSKGKRSVFNGGIEKFNKDRRDLFKQKDAIKSGEVVKIGGNTFDYSRLSSSDRKAALRSINDLIRSNSKTLTILRQDKFWKDVGQIEGVWYGIGATLGPGGLAAIANGDFYDPKKGYFGCPSFEDEFLIGIKDDPRNIKYVKARRDTRLVFDGKDKSGNNIYKAVDKKLINQYNEAMVNIYYWNPVTLLKTLVTGERFAWMADKNQTKILEEFGEDNLKFLADSDFLIFFKKYQGSTDEEKLELLASNAEYQKMIEKVGDLLKKNPELLKRIAKAQKFAEKYDRLKNLAVFFSQPQKILNIVEKWGKEKTKSLREFLSNKILKKIFKGDEVVQKIFDDWVSFGVGKTLVAGITKGITSWIIKIVGVTSSTVTMGISLLVSFILSDVFEKISKLTIKILLFSIMGVLGLFVLIIGGVGTFKKQAETDGYSRIVAGDVYYNEEFTSYGYDLGIGDESGYDNPNSGALAEFVPGNLPDGMTCLFGSGPSLRCSQGPYSSCSEPGYHQPSHYNSPAIDVATGGNFAAPQFCDVAQGNCKVVSVGQETCQGGSPAGGYVIFTAEYNGRVYQFFILHVAIGVSSGEILGPGQAVATITHDASWQNCSTGLHAHLTVKVNGSYVDPSDVLNQDFGCSISTCPVEDVCYWLL